MEQKENSLLALLESETGKRDDYHAGLQARSKGLLPEELKQASVVIVGTGSVGSYAAEKLARAGVGDLVLIDPDKVERHNITRSTFRADDVGKAKVDALREHLLAINPFAAITAVPSTLEDMDKAQLRQLVGRAHLILCGADTRKTEAVLNRIAAYYDKPLISPGLYKGAKGGEVVVYVPGITVCLECTLAGRQLQAEMERRTDYGTGRLEGEIALGADIHFLTGAAVKLSLSMLSLTLAGDDVAASAFIKGALLRGYNYLLMAMEPDYWIFKPALQGAPAQYAYQSLWLATEGRTSCEICGEHKLSEDPIDAIVGKASMVTLAGALADKVNSERAEAAPKRTAKATVGGRRGGRGNGGAVKP